MTVFRPFVATAILALAACRPDAPDAEPPAPGPVPLPQPSAVEEPTADGVWQQLQADDYRTWALWPGTSERYPGTEPHGMLLTTYVNEPARTALESGRYPLPDGAIVVKENYMPDGTYDASTVMVKRAGYAPDHNDWFWAKYDAAGTAEVAGRVEMCQSCHAAARDRDHLMTGAQQP